MKLRKTAAITLAALTAVSASICAFAEENDVKLATLKWSDVHGMTGLANLGDGYFLYHTDDSNAVRGIVHIEKNDKGELTYTDVETDLDLSKNLKCRNANDEYFQLYETDAEGNTTKRYVMHLDKANNKATTVYSPSTDWSYTTNNGYTFNVSDTAVTLYKPDGTTVKHDICAYAWKVDGSGKYIAYFSERYNETTDENGFTLADCRVYGMDRDGKLKELFGAEQIVNGIDIKSSDENHVLLRVNNVMVRDFVVDLNTGVPSDALNLGDLNFIGLYNGLIATEHGIYDPQAKKYLNTTDVTIVSTADNGKTYLVKNADGKYGYLDKNGKQIGDR